MVLELRPYQREGVDHLKEYGQCILSDEPGLGKTAQALVALDELNAYPALVVAPASLTLNWKKEAELWCPGKKVAIYPESPKGCKIYVISVSSVARNKNKLMNLGYKTIIVDECHTVKNRDSKRTRAVCGFEATTGSRFYKGLAHKAKYRFFLSGTPAPNRPVELLTQLQALGRLDAFGGPQAYLNRYCAPTMTRFGMDYTGASNTDELYRILNKRGILIRRRKRDHLAELPDKSYGSVILPINNRKDYNAAERDVAAFLGKDYGEGEALVRLTTLRRMAAEGKLKAANDWIENFLESGEKLVVFAHHKEVTRGIYEKFEDRAVQVVGGMTSKEKDEAVQRFQNDDSVKLFVGNIQSAGTGLTLTSASNVAMVELPWTPADLEQCCDRCHRIGQKESVNVYYLIAERTIDEDIAGVLDSKRKVTTKMIDGQAPDVNTYIKRLLDRLK